MGSGVKRGAARCALELHEPAVGIAAWGATAFVGFVAVDGAVVGLGVDHLPVDLDAFGAAELTASEARLRPAVGWCAADELGGAAPLRGDGEVESRSHGPLFAAFDGVGEAFA
ncbi:hypothetical protein, partial [Rhodococcus rhodnii]|uniref:hypothetical protein n=1 Tax=Rhodococcus rhodnii TaxID=38312 RepID=UPI001475FF86